MSTGRLSIRNEMDRSRHILAHAVEKCREPAPDMAEDKLRYTLRDCMTLAYEIETVEDMLGLFSVNRDRQFETATRDYQDRSHGRALDRRPFEMLCDRWSRMRGFTARVADLAGIPNPSARAQGASLILGTEIVDACFDAALGCEQNYETARLVPVKTTGVVC